MTTTVDIGAYADGEIPAPLEYQFLADDGTPIDLSGYDAEFSLKIGDDDAITLPASVSDADAGKVTHTWLEGELVRTGVYGGIRCEFIVTNGTNTYVSLKLTGFLRRAIYYAGS